MAKMLACRCKENGCDHWEVILDETHTDPHVDGLEAAILRCKTCGATLLIDVEPHQDLIVVERPE